MEFKIAITAKGKIFEGKAPEIMYDELTAGMYEGIALIERNVKRFTPVGVFGSQGGLLSTEHGEVIGKGTPIVKGIVATSSKYGEVIEKGRRAGKAWPPEGALLRWIVVKFNIWGKASSLKSHKVLTPEQLAQSVEFIIRRKIGRKGFPGAHMFERGLNASEPGLQTIFDRRGFNIARKING
jgi:hypothetical protein